MDKLQDLEKWKHKNPLWYLVLKYPEKPWNWHGISWNPTITMDIISANPLKPWDWDAVSQNQNITLEFIEANLDKINFTNLSENKFTFIRKKYQQKQCKLVLFTLRNFLPQHVQNKIAMEYLYQKIK